MARENPWIGRVVGPSVVLDDFSQLVPADLLADAPTPGRWELRRGCWGASRGELLCAGADQQAPILRLPLPVKGRHAIHVRLYAPADRQLTVYLRLDGQPHFTNVQTLRHEPAFERIFFTSADLTGRTLEIAALGRDCALDAIELTPVAEQPLPQKVGQLLGILDFACDSVMSAPAGYEAGSAVRRHHEAGYDILAWKAYAVRCEYHTKIGTIRGDSAPHDGSIAPDHPAGGKATIGALLQRYDTMRQAVDTAREIGQTIFGWARISNEFTRKNHQFSPDTPFHLAHPDACQLYKSGGRSCKLSFADPQVCQHKSDLLCEIAGYGVDGLLIDVLRHPPMVQWDLPLVLAYQKKTGIDPRTLPGDGTEDWLRFRAQAFTDFLLQTRRQVRERCGRHVPVYVRTVDQPWYNLLIGCDVEAWLKQGAVDGLIFGPWCATAPNFPDELACDDLIALARGKVPVFGQVWRYGSGIHAEVMAKQLYERGCTGVAMYESNASVCLANMRDRLWRFSRPAALLG